MLSVSGDEQFNSTILMLKIMESSTRSTLSEVLRLLHSLCKEQDTASAGTSRGGEEGMGGGEKVEKVLGLGDVLHKLSRSMEDIASKVDRQSLMLEVQMDAIKLLQAPEALLQACPPQAAPPGSHAAMSVSRRSGQEAGGAVGGDKVGRGQKDGMGWQDKCAVTPFVTTHDVQEWVRHVKVSTRICTAYMYRYVYV